MIIRTVIIFLILSLCTDLQANSGQIHSVNDKEKASSIFDSFYDDEKELSITLVTDLDVLINDRNREDYQDAQMIYENQNKEKIEWSVSAKPRGKFRRRICDFPPVKLKFSKKELARAGLNDHNDLKLVTHCLADKQEGLDNVMREFLAYKLYNLLTPKSFRVQLVKIQYKDSKGKLRPIKRYGFLLEDTDEMAERLGGEECSDCVNPDQSRMDSYEENMLSVFQYMIGNADWSLMMARNVKYVERPSGKLLAVPFDFDFSGLVDASYAVPNREYGQWSVQNRVFMGFQPDEEVLFQTLYNFSQQKKALYAEVKKCKGLKADTRNFINAYLDRFFYAIEHGTEEELLALFTPAVLQIPLTPSPDPVKLNTSGGIRK